MLNPYLYAKTSFESLFSEEKKKFVCTLCVCVFITFKMTSLLDLYVADHLRLSSLVLKEN